jgi:hypothetical protein
VTINATIYSEEGYDFAYIKINDVNKWTSSNSGFKSIFALESYNVKSGDIIKFQYIKDSSVNIGDDKLEILIFT